jgi:predicted protein tyrosine phosphatase
MFELKITNIVEALRLSQDWATHTVSLIDPDYPLEVPKPGQNAVLRRYFFHDISSSSSWWGDGLDLKLATTSQIEDILEFTTPLQPSDKLLVHCHAGISRSTAVACGVLCQHGLMPKLAVRYVFSIRPQAFPNSHIITLFDQILGLEGRLIKSLPEVLDAFYSEQLLEDMEDNSLDTPPHLFLGD